MEYTRTITRTAENGAELTYGLLRGSSTIVFIKCGRGGDCRGYEDKYLRMAHRIRETRGYTVICSPNPMGIDSYAVDESVIRDHVREEGWDSFDLRLFGGSNGAYQILLLGTRISETGRVLCVNIPLMLNYHKITRAVASLEGAEKLFVFGEKDQSASYVPFLESKRFPRTTVQRVAGADHNFTGMLEAYIELSDWL